MIHAIHMPAAGSHNAAQAFNTESGAVKHTEIFFGKLKNFFATFMRSFRQQNVD